MSHTHEITDDLEDFLTKDERPTYVITGAGRGTYAVYERHRDAWIIEAYYGTNRRVFTTNRDAALAVIEYLEAQNARDNPGHPDNAQSNPPHPEGQRKRDELQFSNNGTASGKAPEHGSATNLHGGK